MKNTYNAEGKRVSKALNTGSPTRYFYEGNKAVFEYANGGTVTAFNVIGANLISRKIGTNKVYYSYNGHGDVTALLDAATKNKRAQYAYDAFGNVTDEKYYDSNGNITTNPANTIKSPIRYGEYQYDSETEYTDAQGNFVTGLYYLNARHYDPGTARFLEVDTYSGNIADPLSLNLYSYCRNEPIMYTDPTGYYTQGKVFSYVEGQPQNPDSDVWELQQDLIHLGFMSKDDVPAGQEGYYGPNTVRAVNKFKNKYLSGGNKGDNEGKFGDTTWLYLKRQVALKNLEGIAKNYFAVETAKIWNEFYSSYDKLIAKPKSSSSTSGNTFDYGKDASSNQGTGNLDNLFNLSVTANEFGDTSDTYRIIYDLMNLYSSSDDSLRQKQFHALALDALQKAREGTPYMYGNDIVMETLKTNLAEMIAVQKFNRQRHGSIVAYSATFTYLTARHFKSGDEVNWDYKWDPNWQVPYDYFNGSDMNKVEPSDGSSPKNYVDWIYFRGRVIGADKVANLNWGYIGTKLGYTKPRSLLFNPLTEPTGDGEYIQMGVDMANYGDDFMEWTYYKEK